MPLVACGLDCFVRAPWSDGASKLQRQASKTALARPATPVARVVDVGTTGSFEVSGMHRRRLVGMVVGVGRTKFVTRTHLSCRLSGS
jgi:hypothetical protein